MVEAKAETSTITACPRCGDEFGGYYFALIERWEYYGAWGEEAHGQFDKVLRSAKVATCRVCGGRIPVDQAEGRTALDGGEG